MADLEDAVAPAEKDAAREVVARVMALAAGGCARLVRVNAPATEWFADDLDAIRDLALDALVVPKATPESVAVLGRDGPPVLALVETAVGLRLAYETARSLRVAALALGAADLGAELGLEPRPDGLEILFARSKLVVDSAAAHVRSPFDVVRLDYRDEAGLEAECRVARSLGMRGKLCIHPAQVPVVNRLFAPSAEEVEWATRVIAAYDGGVVGLEGTMVDEPVVERARRILAETKGRSE